MRKLKNYSFLLLLVILFNACANKDYVIKDLREIDQNTSLFAKEIIPFDEQSIQKLDKEFDTRYFLPWDINISTYTLEKATWGLEYKEKKLYGFNKRILDTKWFDKNIKNANYENFNKISQKAITIKNTNMRVFPTNDMILGDPNEAGEGYPFDYNQISTIKINTPIFISHYSLDFAWAFVESNFVIGWIKTSDMVTVDDSLIKKFRNANYAVAIKDDFPIYNNGNFQAYIKLGTIFPIVNNKFMLIQKDIHNHAVPYYITDENIVSKPIKFNSTNITNISMQLLNEPYGWGGVLDKRDCSSTTQDFFTPFGIYLKRNSFGQTQDYKYISLENLNDDEKKKFIITNGKPFRTLLYLKGHIVLYIGKIGNEPIIFHEVWGVRTLNFDNTSGRQIIGKTVITTTEPGKELFTFDKSSAIIKRVEGIVFVGEDIE